MGKGRAPCSEKVGLKKGSWTPAEDMRLVAYIQKFGHGNWRALPKLAGLLRCGKSCRLRWINYLRPDIRRGNFTKEEEETVIQLHKLLGNKWSKIAARLPGRTDNEIKNVWNTHLKKRVASSGPASSAQLHQSGNDNQHHIDEKSADDEAHTGSITSGGSEIKGAKPTKPASTNVQELLPGSFGSCSHSVRDVQEYSSSSSASTELFEIPADPQGLDEWKMLHHVDLVSATFNPTVKDDAMRNHEFDTGTMPFCKQHVAGASVEVTSCSSSMSNSGMTECTAISRGHDALGFLRQHNNNISGGAVDQTNQGYMVDDEVQLSDMLLEPDGIWQLLEPEENQDKGHGGQRSTQLHSSSMGSMSGQDQPHHRSPTTHLVEQSANHISSDDSKSWIQYLEKELDLSDDEELKQQQSRKGPGVDLPVGNEEDPVTRYFDFDTCDTTSCDHVQLLE